MGVAVAVPEPGTQLTLAQIESFEMSIAAALPEKDDVEELQEWLNQTSALASYIKRRDLMGPIMGAQRRIEARIGQLLPEPARGRTVPEEIKQLFPHATERHQFRLLATAAEQADLSEEDWRQPRSVLTHQIREQLGQASQPRVTPKRLLSALTQAAESAHLAHSLRKLTKDMSDEQRAEARTTTKAAVADLMAVLKALPE